MDEMVHKLAEHGVNPEALKTHEGCMSELMRMAETMGETMKKGEGGLGDLDWDHEPEPPDSDEKRKMYGETAAKMSAYAEKLKKFAESMSGTVNGDPIKGVTEVRPGPSGSEKSGLGGPSENVSKTAGHTKMSEEVERYVEERLTLLRAEFKPIIERSNEQDQLDVINFCEQMVRDGRLTPAQIDPKDKFSVLSELLDLNNTQVVDKFSEKGREVPLTKRRKRMEQIKRGPKVWKNSEVAANGTGGKFGEIGSADQGEAQIEKFCEEHLLGDDIKTELKQGWEAMKKHEGSRADVSRLLSV
jgi:hypothetical protein